MQVVSRDSYRLVPANCTQEQKYAVHRTFPVLKSGNVYAGCLKGHFSISFSEEMVALFDFLFVRRSFLGRRPSKNTRISNILLL